MRQGSQTQHGTQMPARVMARHFPALHSSFNCQAGAQHAISDAWELTDRALMWKYSCNESEARLYPRMPAVCIYP